MSRSSEIRTQRYKASRQRQQQLMMLQQQEEEEEEEELRPPAAAVNPDNILNLCTHTETYNISPLLVSSIKSTPFYKSRCCKLNSYNELVDEIYLKVSHLDPFDQENAASTIRPASPAFCLLLRMLDVKLTRKQMQAVLGHGDSPFIRALGALYLRYVGQHDELWTFWEPLFQDQEQFTPHRGGKSCTVGDWMRSILDVRYHGTVFPRIPVPIERAIRAKLDTTSAPESIAVGVDSSAHESVTTSYNPPSDSPTGKVVPTGTKLTNGMIVRAKYWEDNKWYDGRVEEPVEGKAEHYWITYLPEEEYGNQEEVGVEDIRLLSSSSAEDDPQPVTKKAKYVPPEGITSYDDL